MPILRKYCGKLQKLSTRRHRPSCPHCPHCPPLSCLSLCIFTVFLANPRTGRARTSFATFPLVVSSSRFSPLSVPSFSSVVLSGLLASATANSIFLLSCCWGMLLLYGLETAPNSSGWREEGEMELITSCSWWISFQEGEAPIVSQAVAVDIVLSVLGRSSSRNGGAGLRECAVDVRCISFLAPGLAMSGWFWLVTVKSTRAKGRGDLEAQIRISKDPRRRGQSWGTGDGCCAWCWCTLWGRREGVFSVHVITDTRRMTTCLCLRTKLVPSITLGTCPLLRSSFWRSL